MHRRGRLHTALFLAIGLGVTGFAILCYGLHFFRNLELTTVDTRFSIRGDRPTPKDVAVVGVDEATYDKLQLQWPYPRTYHASVISRLHKAGAKVIAMDIQFTVPTSAMPGCGLTCENLATRQDNQLILSVGRNRPVVLAT